MPLVYSVDMRISRLCLIVAIGFAAARLADGSDAMTVESPDGKVRVTFSQGRPLNVVRPAA